MEWVAELLQEPIVQGLGGGGLTLGVFQLVRWFLAAYMHQETTEQKEADRDVQLSEERQDLTRAVSLIASQSTKQMEIFATLNNSLMTLTDVLARMGARQEDHTKQVARMELAVQANTGAVDTMARHIGDAVEVMKKNQKTIARTMEQTQDLAGKVATQMSQDDINDKLDRALAILERLEQAFNDQMKPQLERVKEQVEGLEARLDSAERDLGKAKAEILAVKPPKAEVDVPPESAPPEGSPSRTQAKRAEQETPAAADKSVSGKETQEGSNDG